MTSFMPISSLSSAVSGEYINSSEVLRSYYAHYQNYANVLVMDRYSPLSSFEISLTSSGNIRRDAPIKLSLREEAFSLFGKMYDFDERQQKLYSRMLKKGTVVKRNVF